MRLITAFSLALVLLAGCARDSAPDVHSETFTYTWEGETFIGYLAHPADIDNPVPGVLVVHEWWGHNAYARQRARDLARLGYAGFALDMYGDGEQADHPERAGEMMSAVLEDVDARRGRFEAALEALRERELVDGGRIAAIGYCFGGNVVLSMAREGADLAGVASFHGMLPTDGDPADDIVSRILVLTGAEDPMVPEDEIETFRTQMETAGADFEIVSYGGVTHGFTNPSADEYGERFELPLAYDAEADADSWQRLETFLQEVFSE